MKEIKKKEAFSIIYKHFLEKLKIEYALIINDFGILL